MWTKRAAEQGSSTAQTNLGLYYLQGNGTEQDYAQARFWMQKAAQGSGTGAKQLLAGMYSHGNGVPQDAAQADLWLRRAELYGL